MGQGEAERFPTLAPGAGPTVRAPDGSLVRVLLAVPGRGSVARFELGHGEVARAVRHRTVAEIWTVVEGRGRMWRADDGGAEVTVELRPGTCLVIPPGVRFQFRCEPEGPALAALAVTLPPWPGEGEAVPAEGPWAPTL